MIIIGIIACLLLLIIFIYLSVMCKFIMDNLGSIKKLIDVKMENEIITTEINKIIYTLYIEELDIDSNQFTAEDESIDAKA